MNDRNHVEKIKDAAVESLKTTGSVVTSVAEFAKGAVTAGVSVGGDIVKAAKDTTSTVASSLKRPQDHLDPAQHETEVSPSPHETEAAPSQSAAEQQPEASKTSDTSGKPKPVNVTRELGLDPSPIAPRKPAKRPLTAIDRNADASEVHATPSDVAKVAGNAPSDGTRATE